MVAVFERKDGTHILDNMRSRQHINHRRSMVLQLTVAATCLTLGIWLMFT